MRLQPGPTDDSWRADPGEAMRRQHERWLSRALASPALAKLRIPRRRVDEGGFGRLVRTRAGRAWAERWWDRAFAEADRA